MHHSEGERPAERERESTLREIERDLQRERER
jgi:hypothetical protein